MHTPPGAADQLARRNRNKKPKREMTTAAIDQRRAAAAARWGKPKPPPTPIDPAEEAAKRERDAQQTVAAVAALLVDAEHAEPAAISDGSSPTKHEVARSLIQAAALRDVPAAYAELRNLAFGLGSWAKAPAVVRRLALLDLFALAGISTEAGKAQSSDKPMNEWSKHQLDAFLVSLGERIQLAARRADAVTLDPDAAVSSVESTGCEADQRTVGPSVPSADPAAAPDQAPPEPAA